MILLDEEDEEIRKHLAKDGVTYVRRIKKRNSTGNLINTPILILTFNTTKLPEEIKVGFLRVKVRMYIPSPLRCTHCQMFGHSKKRCFGNPKCGKCAQELHNKTTCTLEENCLQCLEEHHNSNCNTKPNCVNCTDNNKHFSFDRKCPRYIIENTISKKKFFRTYQTTPPF